MSQTELTITYKRNGTPTDVSAVYLSDPAATYGVKRLDTGVAVVAAGTVMASAGVGTGSYSYTFDDPAAGLTYQWYAKVIGTDATTKFFGPFTKIGSLIADDTFSRYLTADEGDSLAGNVGSLGLSKWPAATVDQKNAALVLATIDVDRGMRYQGRKVDPAQPLEFPRVPYAMVRPPVWAGLDYPGCGLGTPLGAGGPENVWDWDPTTLLPIVPTLVKLAALYQADYTLSGKRDDLLDRIEQGITSSKIGSGAETYDLAFLGQLANEMLCRRSLQFLDRYRIRQGRIL